MKSFNDIDKVFRSIMLLADTKKPPVRRFLGTKRSGDFFESVIKFGQKLDYDM